ncbi:uncharacterized protein LOC128721931 [Anopheles nili]|uniref:uncharacterized protein LOC128721931 n=1 Tax=Anopheles nili TaxID=185578 RepID=UPI00237ABDA3|nr:uncharacterized protein LOC128721931 [Anopheles nili]
MLDGREEFMGMYIQTPQSLVKQQDTRQPINNNNASYANRNDNSNGYNSLATAIPNSQRTDGGWDHFAYCTKNTASKDGFLEQQQGKEKNVALHLAQPKEEAISNAAPFGIKERETNFKQIMEEPVQQCLVAAKPAVVAFEELEGPQAKNHRRPMNAFLMFCKRHRAVVSLHYPHKENRFITKVLGDWWKQLTEEDKQPYEDLAKEHKTKFISANPGFRWCKQEKMDAPAYHVQNSVELTSSSATVKTEVPDFLREQHESSMEAAESLVKMAQGVGLPPMTTFKLADETQMGSLSALYTARPAGSSWKTGFTSDASKLPEHNYSEPCKEFNNQLHNQERPLVHNISAVDQPGQRQSFCSQSRPKAEWAYRYEKSISDAPSTDGKTAAGVQTAVAVAVDVEQGYPRASRSCKGKRYREFMHQQFKNSSVSSVRKTQQKRSTPATTLGTSVNCIVAQDAHGVTDTCGMNDPSASSMLLPAQVDFNALTKELDAKIHNLPCMDIADFLSKKKDEKKRKKPYALSPKAWKNKVPASSLPKKSIPFPMVAEAARPATTPVELPTISVSSPPPPVVVPAVITQSPAKIVGCRKRKAPKENITRNPDPSVLERQPIKCGPPDNGYQLPSAIINKLSTST